MNANADQGDAVVVGDINNSAIYTAAGTAYVDNISVATGNTLTMAKNAD